MFSKNRIYPKKEKLVIDIRCVLRLRLLCCFYHELFSSKLINNLVKVYCIVFATFQCIYVVNISFLPSLTTTAYVILYVFFTISGLIWKDRFLIEYFKCDHVIDGFSCSTYRKLSSEMKYFLVYIIIYRLLYIIFLLISCRFYLPGCYQMEMLAYGLLVSWCDLGSFSCYMIYDLLFYRVKFLHENLQHDRRSRNLFETKKYVHKYYTIFNGFNEVKDKVKYIVSKVLHRCNVLSYKITCSTAHFVY